MLEEPEYENVCKLVSTLCSYISELTENGDSKAVAKCTNALAALITAITERG